MREVVLDCETTGLDPREGHRIIELAAVELDGVRIGRRWHSLFDPRREVPKDATAIHGLTDADLKGQPRFEAEVDSFIEFVGDAVIIAHNAPFDRSFLSTEMWRCRRTWKAEWIDTLPLARKKVPRGRHTLDALCMHFGIRKTARKIHGAVLDTTLLAEVYIRLAGRLDQLELTHLEPALPDLPHPGPRPKPLLRRITIDELRAHKLFMREIEKDRTHAEDN